MTNSTPLIAVIGGTGLTALTNLKIERREVVSTPFGEPSGPLTFGNLAGKQVVFLPRHGHAHTIAPHKINYRANLWALRHVGVDQVIAVAAVGGIGADMQPQRLALPDQLIDYTYSRAHTFFEESLEHVTHIDFSEPYHAALRQQIIETARTIQMDCVEYGTYGATQGPRLETIAEINRMAIDGCHLVGMTGMPEAALARELGLNYACIAAVANWAAGRGEQTTITMRDIADNLEAAMQNVRRLLEALIVRV